MSDSEKPMWLYYSPGSPYARKVRVALREKQLLAQVDEIALSPHDDAPELLAANPLGKVPVLVGGDVPQGAVFDSPLICECLDGLSPHGQLIPAGFAERLAVLRVQALADGIMDAAVASVLEQRRSDASPSAHWLRRWQAAASRAVDVLAASTLPPVAQPLDVGSIAAACALGYLSFRMPALAWRARHPALAAWADGLLQQPAFVATAPPTA